MHLFLRHRPKDGSTEEHARRVALLAVQVGEELGLPYPALRQLAIGGLLHDIGKLAVPAAILRKPAQLGATRILAVCDVYDALVSDRVYRPAWSAERALELLRREAGSAFDGRCVHALARVVQGSPAREAVQAAW